MRAPNGDDTSRLSPPAVSNPPEPPACNSGGIRLRAVTVGLDTDVGQAFVVDCARNTEGLLSDREIKVKYELSEDDWQRLADNTPLHHAVRAERERRIQNGDAPKEAAQRHFAKAPNVLNRILTDEQIAPRHRIEAARELRQVAGSGPAPPGSGEKFVITINLGGDEKFVFEKNVVPLDPTPIDDGEL